MIIATSNGFLGAYVIGLKLDDVSPKGYLVSYSLGMYLPFSFMGHLGIPSHFSIGYFSLSEA
jgi:hypothetical protein